MPPRNAFLILCALCMLLAVPAGANARPPEREQRSDADGSGKATDHRSQYTNRLIHSRDPYLLMHAHNPVDWYPWGPEAFAAARREHKPIFVSIGYSSCYWCHVAEREIYSNPEIAKLMNAWFINVKVDREERPDVDRIYMLATQLLTGGGGWPNNLFLTPDLKPFYAGSYFPPQERDGEPGFPQILTKLHDTWRKDPAQLQAIAERIDMAIRQATQHPAGDTRLDIEALAKKATQAAAREYDEFEGGFARGGVTKFPHEPLLSLLLVQAEDGNAQARDMLIGALRAMAEGGIMDQLGGGFHRYSTDPSWNIPHFEKMLYDNAQLLGLYARAHALTGEPLFKQVASITAGWLKRELHAPGGGFYSARDAEVDGIEGASYVWTSTGIDTVLGKTDAKRFLVVYALTPMPEAPPGHRQPSGGVLRIKPGLSGKATLAERIDALAPLREKLLGKRNTRRQPSIDRKIVTAGNALAIIGFLEAGRALDIPAMRRTAVATADWTWRHAYDRRAGIVHHQYFDGHAGGEGLLDDYALLGQAFLALYLDTRQAVWRGRARRLADAMRLRFQRADGRLASSPDATLPEPPPEGDSTQPSGQSAAVALLLGLAAAGDFHYAVDARRALASISRRVGADPSKWGALLASLSEPGRVAALARSGPSASADHVRATARMTPDGLYVTLAIDEGFHINANPASSEGLIATTLALDGIHDVPVDYPPGEVFRAPFVPQGISVYSGTVELRARLPRCPHPRPSKARLRIQACNDRYCLAPSSVELALPQATDTPRQ